MKTNKANPHSALRLRQATAILAAAEVANVRLIQKRVDAFADAQRAYAKAQRALDAAEAELRAGRARAAARDAQQGEALEALARALVAAGQPRLNPFAAFNMPAPSSLRQLPFNDQVQAIHKLAAAVQLDRTTHPAVRRAAQAVEDAAQKTEKELAPTVRLIAAVRSARTTRDGMGKTWDVALAALKRGARAAADDGAADLYTRLFGRESRPKKKPTPATAASAAAAPAAAPANDIQPQ